MSKEVEENIPDKPLGDGVKNSQIIDGKETFHVKIYAPFRTYFDGMAISLTALNGTGPFDILAHHKNFMTLIDACEVVVNAPDGEHKIPVAHAVMHVKEDAVLVFLDV